SHLDAIAELLHEVIQDASYAIQVLLYRVYRCARRLQSGAAVGEYGTIVVLRREVTCVGDIYACLPARSSLAENLV
ncbi:MAG: hypothetical protein IJH04_07310, partial [Eggerthellaceae bacterium]|nr:hypothetical protein [Eggerthellaceae bacterium]